MNCPFKIFERHTVLSALNDKLALAPRYKRYRSLRLSATNIMGRIDSSLSTIRRVFVKPFERTTLRYKRYGELRFSVINDTGNVDSPLLTIAESHLKMTTFSSNSEQN